jgi:cytochrome c
MRNLRRASVPLTVGLLAATTGLWADSNSPALQGDPFRGRGLFVEKGCSRCHSVWGHGGTLGPDIVVAVMGKTWYELVGDFWNHTPRMILAMTEEGHAWPTLEPAEMADALSYLYYLRLFDELGDPEEGRHTYARLQCGGCHQLGGKGPESGSPLDRFGTYPSPVPLAQAMWNAGPMMQREQLRRGNPIPQFVANEVADLQAYIRAEGVRKGRDVVLQPLPDPVRGEKVFRDKQCGVCHRGSGRSGPDIRGSALSKTVSEITGLLWNHSYAMHSEMTDRGIPFPRFVDTELSDLIAHLYFLGYVGEDGDSEEGARLFRDKGCIDCHQGTTEGVLDLTTGTEEIDRTGLAAAMWNHAPDMYRLMEDASPFWPKFEPGEMRNLAAYLRSGSGSAREGRQRP